MIRIINLKNLVIRLFLMMLLSKREKGLILNFYSRGFKKLNRGIAALLSILVEQQACPKVSCYLMIIIRGLRRHLINSTSAIKERYIDALAFYLYHT
jgi:hypothetical protein